MTETRRLYYEDAYLNKFDARVLECRVCANGYEILLDQSAFYPEGGGQPADRGTLNTLEVLDVQEKGGELLHLIASPMNPGESVCGKIDWGYRFDLMQQHSGEHMVSGLIHEAYGYDNVGFHMGSDVITIDFSGILTWEQLLEIEEKVNQKIWENCGVEIAYPSEEELASIPYRSKKELTGQVRIVTFPGTDICACCGIHVAATGEIGMVRILSVVKFREGVRVEMICGGRVQSYLRQIDEQNRQVSQLTSTKPFETAASVKRLQEEIFRLRGTVLRLQEASFAAEAERQKNCGNVLLFREEMTADSVRKLCDAVMQVCGGRCAVFSINEDGSYKYAVGEKDGDLRGFVKEMNETLHGRGGGRPFFAQGSVTAAEEEIRTYWKQHVQ